MPLTLASHQDEPSRQDAAVQARILAEQALSIVRHYGPRAVLLATADALTYYEQQATAGEPGTGEARAELAYAVQAARQAVAALDRETIRHFART